jgi:hypothetical protein
VQRLSARFRSRMRNSLRHTAPELYARIPSRVWREPWVVHSQFAGRGPQALSYLARYVSKTALSSKRLIYPLRGFPLSQCFRSQCPDRIELRLPAGSSKS